MPPLKKRGFTIFYGLSGSGKIYYCKWAIGQALEHGGRTVTLLDGDLVRTHLSSELGFQNNIDL